MWAYSRLGCKSAADWLFFRYVPLVESSIHGPQLRKSVNCRSRSHRHTHISREMLPESRSDDLRFLDFVTVVCLHCFLLLFDQLRQFVVNPDAEVFCRHVLYVLDGNTYKTRGENAVQCTQ